MLNIENLRVDLDTDDAVIRAVDAMWLSIERGETFALVGESGCGNLSLQGFVWHHQLSPLHKYLLSLTWIAPRRFEVAAPLLLGDHHTSPKICLYS